VRGGSPRRGCSTQLVHSLTFLLVREGLVSLIDFLNLVVLIPDPWQRRDGYGVQAFGTPFLISSLEPPSQRQGWVVNPLNFHHYPTRAVTRSWGRLGVIPSACSRSSRKHSNSSFSCGWLTARVVMRGHAECKGSGKGNAWTRSKPILAGPETTEKAPRFFPALLFQPRGGLASRGWCGSGRRVDPCTVALSTCALVSVS